MKLVGIILAAILLTIVITADAADTSARLNVTVTVVKGACIINNNQIIDVDFGNNVLTTDVAAGLARKQIEYTLDCADSEPGKTLLLSVSGTGADFDSDYLKTSIPGLGVKIEANGLLLPLNNRLALVSSAAKPDLSAILVQDEGIRLPAGEFNAIATMTADYQ